MKQLGFLLAWLALSLVPAAAQVTVEVTLPQEQFLPGEALPVAVRIVNRSGHPLRLGSEEDWLSFSIEARDNVVVAKLGEVPVLGAFSVESSQRATKRVDLAPYFALIRPGRYTVVATVRIKDWDREITSKPKGFDVIQGTKLWEQEFGVPGSSSGTNGAPEVRKYILQQANHIRGDLRLYMRLTDASGAKVFRVYAIGPLLSFSRPEHQVDRFSNLHVLYANGPQAYSYTVFSPSGVLLERQVFDYVDTRPRLQGDDSGKVSVAGGVRREPPAASPAVEPATPPDDTTAPKS